MLIQENKQTNKQVLSKRQVFARNKKPWILVAIYFLENCSKYIKRQHQINQRLSSLENRIKYDNSSSHTAPKKKNPTRNLSHKKSFLKKKFGSKTYQNQFRAKHLKDFHIYIKRSNNSNTNKNNNNHTW